MPRRTVDPNTIPALHEVKLIPGRHHVAAVPRDVGPAHFRAGETPPDSAVVGVQAEQHPVSLHVKAAVG